MPYNKNSTLFSVVIILIAMFSIQSGASLAKSLFYIMGPLEMTALRIAFGAFILLFLLRPWRKWSKWKVNKINLIMLIGYGISLAVMNLSFYYALVRIPIGIAVALEFTGPLTVALLASRKPIDFMWVILAVIGLYFLLPLRESINAIDPIGAIFALIAGFFWACYIFFGKRVGEYFGTSAVALGTLLGAILILPVALFYSYQVILSSSVWRLAFCVALLSTAIPYTLEMTALTRLPSKTFGTLMSMEPVIGALCGLLFLGERLTLIQWLALSAIVIASIGAILTFRSSTTIVEIENNN